MDNDNQSENAREQFDAGRWLGRREAFDLMASKCSAADAECLRTLRDQKKYKELGISWEEFCTQHAGISRAYADRIIQLLNEFGPAYFHLSRRAPVSPDTYRRIAASVGKQGLEFNGETIAFTAENSRRLLEAVNALRQQPAGRPRGRIATMERRLEACCVALLTLVRCDLPAGERTRLLNAVEKTAARLNELSQML